MFREDLYYRLNSVTLEIPPLRERPEDIEVLVRYFLAQCGATKSFDAQAQACLRNYSWPGNVRELRHCILGLDALVDGPVVRLQDLPSRMQRATQPVQTVNKDCEPLDNVIRRVEREHFCKVLELTGGNNEEAIRVLSISRAKFFQRKKEFGL
jgi:DNA-binding NtrC family response regulator